MPEFVGTLRNPGISFGAAPPGSPVDGNLWVLPFDTTAGVMWMFRYRSASASTYKWEFIGGPPAYAEVVTTQTTTTTATWLDLATVGPQITVPRAGDYLGIGEAAMTHSATVSQTYVGLALNAAAPAIAGLRDAGGALNVVVPIQGKLAGMAAGDNLRMRYYNATTGTATYQNRQLSVFPCGSPDARLARGQVQDRQADRAARAAAESLPA